jgi:C-terminal processing protease CtpA/Prc
MMYNIVLQRGKNGFGMKLTLETDADQNGAAIIGIKDGSPAFHCGKLQVGDRILRIDDVDVGYGDSKVQQILQACRETQEVTFLMLRDEADSDQFTRVTDQRAADSAQMATTPSARKTPIMPGEEVEVRYPGPNHLFCSPYCVFLHI